MINVYWWTDLLLNEHLLSFYSTNWILRNKLHCPDANVSSWYVQFLCVTVTVWWQAAGFQLTCSQAGELPQRGGGGGGGRRGVRVSSAISSGRLSGPVSISAEGEQQRMMGQRTDMTCYQQLVVISETFRKKCPRHCTNQTFDRLLS